MIFYVVFCSLLCGAALAADEECFDYGAINDTLIKTASDCADSVTTKGQQCKTDYRKCFTDELGFFKDVNNTAVDNNKFISWISDYANPEIKDNISTDLADCGSTDEEAKTEKYFKCFLNTYERKCSGITKKFFSFGFEYLRGGAKVCGLKNMLGE